MNTNILEISRKLEHVKWIREGHRLGWKIINFPDLIPDNWPTAYLLKKIFEKNLSDDQGRNIGEHVKGVIASINDLIGSKIPDDFLISSNDYESDNDAKQLIKQAYGISWIGFDSTPLFENRDLDKALIRVAALYHDVGQLISTDRHISRGVHLLRDVNVRNRQEIENLFDDIIDKRNFWALLRHHDLYGCLCTGEASLPAISDMVSWTHPKDSTHRIIKSVAKHFTFLLWLNIADVNARLFNIPSLGGITTVEACRYLNDWKNIKNFLTNDKGNPREVKREEFKNWLLEIASRPEMTINRITRLISSGYRKEMGSIPPDQIIETFVEEELQALLGPRLEIFCYRFARFCKLEYGLRFFYLLIRHALIEAGLIEYKNKKNESDYPKDEAIKKSKQESEELVFKALRIIVNRTCLILNRIVEEYGHLVDNNHITTLRVGVDMSGLMRPKETGWSICQSLKQAQSRALWWISDEISVWLFIE